MRLLKKTFVLFLAITLFISTQTAAVTVLAAEVNEPDVTVLQNDFIKVTVDNATGRYGIRTVEGQPIRKNDQNVNMLFRGDDPETSFTTFRINNTDYIFGNPYKFAADFFSEISKPRIVNNPDGTSQIETVWKIKGVEIKQILMLYMNAKDVKNAGNVNIRYEVVNRSGAEVQIGSRILLDTMVAGKDGPEFQIGTAYRAPLTVERKLTHDPAAEGVPDADIAYYKLPQYWVMRDNLDLTNPLATNVIAYGFNNIAENQINIVDEMIVGHWNGLANTKWDYQVNPNLDFTRDTNDYGTADSAVAFYWNPKKLGAGEFKSFETIYGLGEIVAPDKVFSIRFLDPVQQLATLPDSSGYENEGIFDIIAEVENLPSFNMEHSEIRLNMTLESGLSFVRLDEQGRIVRDPETGKAMTESFRSKELRFQKPATIEELEQGIIPKYKPGDTITASFKVMANGRPWPTTKQYLLTARSPETQDKLQGLSPAGDEGLMAEYESTQANFVLLPAIGEAAATYVYAMSPKELYQDDVKYMTVNLTNIEAYQTGDANSDPNFDLYLKETVTGQRYKVPVKDSVLLQPTDDGASGDMRITYRGGDKVDANGVVVEAGLGPELPLGEYQIQIDYKGDAGGDPELAALFDMTTPQTFLVTDNNVARIREANIAVVYKQTLDLSLVPIVADEDDLEPFNEVFTYAPFKPGTTELADAKQSIADARPFLAMKSRVVDPDLDVGDLMDPDTLSEVPVYNFEVFASDEEVEQFFEDRDDREQLVTIRGMIKQIGTGTDIMTVVDTTTEPAIINDAVAYKGKDLGFVRGDLEVFGQKYETPFLDTLFVKGDGVLSVANSGFVFHRGEWTLDFYNGFDKTLDAEIERPEDEEPEEEEEEEGSEEEENTNPEDDTLNGSLKWAQGTLGNRLNPVRQLMIPQVYFNKQSIFSMPYLSIGGFGFEFYDTMLRPGGVSFGGIISFKVVEGEIKNVVFNDKGFVGVDAALRFKLDKDLGMIKPESGTNSAGGEITVVHYEQEVEGISNTYGLSFEADLENIAEIGVEFSLKKVADGRILPDVVAFSSDLPKPGVLITGATYLHSIRGALRELADTIAGGTADDPFPLTIEAGVSLRFGIAPAYHFGDIDLTLKRTGIKLEGVLSFSTKEDPSDDDLVPMITQALIEAQWVTPWFVRLEAEVDVMGWDVIVGKAGIFVGQNLEKNRIDFEGFIGAKVQIPGDVPIVGGMPLASVFLGVNNDKIWGKVGVLLITLGITYYWGGGISFGTSGEGLPEGLIHMVVEDPEKGPQLVVIGQGVETVATSWHNPEQESQGIVYREVADGVKVIEHNAMNVGIGGIAVKNGGRVHDIPMGGVTGNALLEVTYDSAQLPELTLRDAAGNPYPIVFDNTNTNPEANAFTQSISAANSPEQVDIRRAYIIVPSEAAKAGGTWTLTSLQPVETKLLSVPAAPELTNVILAKDAGDPNQFTASWTVAHAQPGDTVSLYLAEEAVADAASAPVGGDAALEPSDPGLIIAKDVPVSMNGGTIGEVTTGSLPIDVTQVSLLGDTEDIRGLLKQGNYYLRAELKSAISYETKTSTERFEIVDPLAPGNVRDVRVEPAGNGMFSLSFEPAAKKAGHEAFEHSYVIEAAVESADGSGVETFGNFPELMFTEQELQPYWNAASGRYEGIKIGGWTQVSLPKSDNDPNPETRYIGLETGRKYVIGVSAVTKPTADADKHENFHFAEQIGSALTLLPMPSHPKLREANEAGYGSMMEVLTNETAQKISLVSDQSDVEVEAFYNGVSIGKTRLTNAGGQSVGELSFDQFVTDGTYGIELMAQNTRTKDKKITMLYLTVDTIAPILYLDAPMTGERTQDGFIRVAGQTTNDAKLTVSGTEIPLDASGNGRFDKQIAVQSKEAAPVLEFVARDGAGNENRASVQVTNGTFKAPVGLLFREMKLNTKESRKLEASLRVPDGTTNEGKPKYSTVPVADSDYAELLSFRVMAGDAVTVSADGVVTAREVGASLLRAEYRVSDGVVLQADVPVSVVVPQPAGLASLGAYTTAVGNNQRATKVVVTDEGDLIGHQLVYRVFGVNTAAAKPQFKEDLSSWPMLPANGIVSIANGQTLVVAKRTSLEKQAVASTGVIVPEIWRGASAGGFFGGGGGGPMAPNAGAQELNLNNAPIKSEWQDNVLVATVTAKDVAAAGEGNIVIKSSDPASKAYLLRFEKEARESLIASGKSVVLDLPVAKLTITPQQLQSLSGDFELRVSPNGDNEQRAAAGVAQSLDAVLLGGGQGAAIKTNLPFGTWERNTAARVAIPEQVRIQDITAVVLRGPNGQWTPLPWRLNMENNEAYAEVSLTGEGSLFFLQNRKSFSDVTDGFWAKTSIEQAASKLLVLGKGDGTFDPGSRVTRAEFPTMLLRGAGLMNQPSSSQFTDVADGDWFRSSVGIAANLGIVNGKGDGSFSPATPLTRVEGMTMAGRVLEVLGADEEMSEEEIEAILSRFEDSGSVPLWARRPTALAIKYGIIQGVNNQIDPDGALTRAQAAAIAVRMDELLANEGV